MKCFIGRNFDKTVHNMWPKGKLSPQGRWGKPRREVA